MVVAAKVAAQEVAKVAVVRAVVAKVVVTAEVAMAEVATVVAMVVEMAAAMEAASEAKVVKADTAGEAYTAPSRLQIASCDRYSQPSKMPHERCRRCSRTALGRTAASPCSPDHQSASEGRSGCQTSRLQPSRGMCPYFHRH